MQTSYANSLHHKGLLIIESLLGPIYILFMTYKDSSL